MRYVYHLMIILGLCTMCRLQESNVNAWIMNVQILDHEDDRWIIGDNKLYESFNDTVFNQQMNCKNGGLNILKGYEKNFMNISYTGPKLVQQQIDIDVSPNEYPHPEITKLDESNILISFKCETNPDLLTGNNYFNKVNIKLSEKHFFAFLLNCDDPKNRHKKFQYGYLILSLLNAIIIGSVAMHSHVWSIKIQQRALRLELKWIPFLIFSMGGVVLLFGLYFFASNNFIQAFLTVRYFGIACSIFFVFICFNQFFYLFPQLKQSFPQLKNIRLCQLISGFLTIVTTVMACLFQNWIFYNFIATCICVGSIKIFHFKSLKQAFIAMLIMVVTVTTVAIILHGVLPRSYNDYAYQLSSPLFLQVPDLVNNLYKKCSWLPIIDIIIPGVTLSYLRLYDQNRSSKYGGIYTVTGNIAFIFATALWITLQAFYPFSVPFSLVTYLSLMLTIFIISRQRNEWTTLYKGTFQQGRDTLNESLLNQQRKSFSQHVTPDMIKQVIQNNSERTGSSIVE